MPLMNLSAGSNRDRDREQTCRHDGGNKGWDELRERQGNIPVTCMAQGAQTGALWQPGGAGCGGSGEGGSGGRGCKYFCG